MTWPDTTIDNWEKLTQQAQRSREGAVDEGHGRRLNAAIE